MKPPIAPPKLFLLTAKEAPVCIVLAKVRKETWHVLRWDLKAGTLQHGSWFVGDLDVSAADVSWDGEYMVYAATNFSRTPPENGWIGLCRPPVLTTQVHANVGWYCWGGGLFTARDELSWENIRDHPLLTQEVVPFRFKHFPRWDADLPSPHTINYEWFMTWRRMRRDGWLKVPESPSHEWRFPHRKVKLTLSAYVGRGTGTFAYQLLERPELLSLQTTEATWDSRGHLLWAEDGFIHRASPDELRAGKGPYQSFDLRGLWHRYHERKGVRPATLDDGFVEPF